MKKMFMLIVAAALCVGCSTTRSFSADLPTKAPARTLSFLDNGYTGNGAYFGLYTEAGGGSVNGSVAGVPSGSLTSTGGAVGIVGGYAWTASNGNAFVALEAGFGWQNFNGNTAGFALSGPASFYQDVKIGTPLSNVLSLLPNNPFGNLSVAAASDPAGRRHRDERPPVLLGGRAGEPERRRRARRHDQGVARRPDHRPRRRHATDEHDCN